MSVADLPCAEQSAPPMDYLAGSTAKIFIKFIPNFSKKNYKSGIEKMAFIFQPI
jgi:hypothetical protein